MRKLSLAASVVTSVVLVSACEQPAPGVFETDVAPILETHCTACHQGGGIAPFSLTSYEDAAANADLIATVTAARLMPPSPIDASGACHEFQGARWMSDDEIAVLGKWAKDGAPGTPGTTLKAPTLDSLDDADVLVEMPAAYTPKATDAHPNDDYRCFVIPPVTDVDSFMQGFEIFPGDAGEVHHMLLFSIPTNRGEEEVQALDDADPGLGFECFSTEFVDETTSFLGGWAPGKNTMRYPEGTGLYLAGGRPLVMQIHYNLLSGARPDLTRVRLKTVPSVQAEAAIFPVADTDMVLPAGQSDAEFGVKYPLAGIADDIMVYGVFPHMHTLGKTLTLDIKPLNAPEDQRLCMVDVWRWDFHWQQLWLYQEPVAVFASDEISLSCTFDTTSRDAPVAWGEGTQDEMCLAFVYVTRINGGPISGLAP